MPNPFHYRAVLTRLARLADAPNPAHVRLAAALALTNELSPGTPRADLAERMLQAANPFEFARHKLRDLYDRSEPLVTIACEAAAAGCSQEEETADEPEDPL